MTLSPPVIQHHDAWASLRKPLERALETCGGLGSICELESPAVGVADSPSKHLIRNRSGEPVAVMLRSQPEAPGLVARAVVKASLARKVLGDDLGSVIVPPMVSGESNGVSFAVYPWRMPLSSSRWLWPLQRAALRMPLLRWLRRATTATLGIADANAVPSGFHEPLRAIASSEVFDQAIRAAAYHAIDRLAAGRWIPRYVLAHNDLWKGNVLLQPRADHNARHRRFVLIDWAASELGGYAFYDLARLAMSMQVSGRRLTRELRAHCSILECELVDAKGYLLACLGYLGTHLECFPVKHFHTLVHECCDCVFSVVDALHRDDST